MYKMMIFLVAAVFLTASLGMSQTDNKSQRLIDKLKTEIQANSRLNNTTKVLAVKKMLPMITNLVFIKETVKQNSKGVTLSQIKVIDEQWKNAEEELPVQIEKMGNKVAKTIKRWIQKNPEFVEVFVMDDQGAVVGENALTGDYWQGDEAKWQNSYKNKSGGLDVGKVKFDKSANQTLQQLSLPIVASGGVVVGAITFGYVVK